MDKIPDSFYVIAGTIVIANIGTIVSVIWGAGKIIWWGAKLDSRVGVLETSHSKDINEAHRAIRQLRKDLDGFKPITKDDDNADFT